MGTYTNLVDDTMGSNSYLLVILHAKYGYQVTIVGEWREGGDFAYLYVLAH